MVSEQGDDDHSNPLKSRFGWEAIRVVGAHEGSFVEGLKTRSLAPVLSLEITVFCEGSWGFSRLM